MADAFRLDRVSVRFGDTVAVDDVSIGIAPGESVAIIGPSGAGKTTLLRCLNGTIRPGRGRVSVDGAWLDTLSDRELRRVRASIGAVPQGFGLVPESRVVQNVIAGRIGRRSFVGALRDQWRPSAAALRDVHDVLESVGIGDKMFAFASDLSGGQAQRVAVARALFQDPRSLLADEPVASVDPSRAAAVIELLTRLARDRQLTLVSSLHDVDLARRAFDRIVGMRAGRARFDRSPAYLDDNEIDALFALDGPL